LEQKTIFKIKKLTMEKNWFENPTKKQTIIFSAIMFVGIVFSILSITNFLSESPFNKKYLPSFFLIISTTIAATQIISNYLKRKNN